MPLFSDIHILSLLSRFRLTVLDFIFQTVSMGLAAADELRKLAYSINFCSSLRSVFQYLFEKFGMNEAQYYVTRKDQCPTTFKI